MCKNIYFAEIPISAKCLTLSNAESRLEIAPGFADDRRAELLCLSDVRYRQCLVVTFDREPIQHRERQGVVAQSSLRLRGQRSLASLDAEWIVPGKKRFYDKPKAQVDPS